MADFIVSLDAGAVIRLSMKSYDDVLGRRNLFLELPHAQIAIFDRVRQVADDIHVPDGLKILIRLSAEDIDSAIANATRISDHTLSMASCVAMGAADVPYPAWAYEATTGVENRQYRHYFYDGIGPRGSRKLNDQHLIALLDKNFNTFMTDANIKDDFKARVQRSMMAFRRGLSDNDDAFNEFLTAWSTMEGVDCVYCKVLPSATVRNFKDGMKDVLQRLGRPELFEPLERLRNDIAHGSLTLDQATQTAHSHLELIRQALVLMILRILKVDETVAANIIAQTTFKGKFRPYVRLIATIQFDPVDVQDLSGHPHVKMWQAGSTYRKNENTLTYEPDIRIQTVNIKSMTPIETQFWGDPAAPIRIGGFESTIVDGQAG